MGVLRNCNLSTLTVILSEGCGVGELARLGNPMGDFLNEVRTLSV